MLKYTNKEKTSAQFNGASFSLTAPDDFASIGDGPTRGAVLKWLLEDNTPEPYVTPPVDIQALIVSAVQARLDAFAVTRNYDGILSACTYATSTVMQFAKEGQAAVNARDATWAALYVILGEVQAATRPVPTGFSDVVALLPALKWPV